jgi:hypothetical protein
MMIDVGEIKRKIIDFINQNGPTLPISIVKFLGLEPVFVSAILAELSNEKRIKTTQLKVGSSCLYYLEGQENLLEEKAEFYLKGVEKEAFLFLKKNKILLDEEQTPVFRVAFRNLRDFAFSFNQDNKIYWKYFLIDKDLLEKYFQEENKPIENEKLNKEIIEDKKDEEKIIEEEIRNNEENNLTKENIEQKNLIEDLTLKDKIKEKKIIKSSFLDEIRLFLNKKEIILKEVLDDSKYEINALIIINSILGDLNYRLIAKNKKSVSDSDLLTAFQKSSNEKYPLYLLINGKLTKKAKEVFEEYKNLILIDNLD